MSNFSKEFQSTKSIILAVVLIISIGCSRKIENTSLFKKNSIHIFTSSRNEKRIVESRKEKFDFDFLSKFYYGNKLYELDKIKVRGQSALYYRRKSFYVNIDGKIPVSLNSTSDSTFFNKFILSAMPMDFTYIENKISQYLLNEAGLWFLKTFFVELYLNNNHQGLYMFIEDPKSYALEQKKAVYLFRRGYDHKIDQVSTTSKKDLKLKDLYVSRFNSIYLDLINLKGEELYISLSEKINLDNYFKKMAIDEILENGDATDEIFFYSNSSQSEVIKFDIIPWDYDDIFNPFPHEVGRKDLLCGKCFGIRQYPTINEILSETKGRLVFSLEDDLDYTIMKDDFLYSQYLKKLSELVNKFDDQMIYQLFEKVQNELLPFYSIIDVIEQSKFDEQQTDLFILRNNLADKKQHLINRLHWLKGELDKQKETKLST